MDHGRKYESDGKDPVSYIHPFIRLQCSQLHRLAESKLGDFLEMVTLDLSRKFGVQAFIMAGFRDSKGNLVKTK